MKKILLAIVLASCAIVAQAQSSVTVYGLLDVGYIGNNYKGTGTSPTTKQTTSSFGNSGETASRLGFKGSEDLGGGTSAFFTVETNLTPTNSTASTWFNRQSFVGLRQKGIGAASIGTQYTPVYVAIAETDPTEKTVSVGDLIYPTSPQSSLYGNTGTAPYEATSSMSATGDAVTVRVANSLALKSDQINGLQGTAMFVQNNQNTTQTSSTVGGTTSYSGYGLSVSYNYDKLYLIGAYQSLKSLVPGSFTSPTPAIWSTATGGTNTLDKQTFAGATYDFGLFKGYAQWINRKATDTINTSYYASRSAQQIGVRAFVTPQIESWASIGNGTLNQWGLAGSNINSHFTGYQIGSNYWLSKRTNLYAMFGSVQTSGVDVSANGYAAGIRHTF